MITRAQVEEYYLRPVELRLCCTDDVSQEALDEVFQVDGWKYVVHADVERRVLFSSEPPSWVHLFATLQWWQTVAVGGVAAGYFQQAGAAIWQSQGKFARLVSERLWSFADRIVALQGLLPDRTDISIAFPSNDVDCPVLFAVESREIDAVAMQIAMLIYHAPAIERTLRTFDFRNIFSPCLSVLGNGSLRLTCGERVGDAVEQRIFYFD